MDKYDTERLARRDRQAMKFPDCKFCLNLIPIRTLYGQPYLYSLMHTRVKMGVKGKFVAERLRLSVFYVEVMRSNPG